MKIEIRKIYRDWDQLSILFEAETQKEMTELEHLYNFQTTGFDGQELMPRAEIDVTNRWLEIRIQLDKGTR